MLSSTRKTPQRRKLQKKKHMFKANISNSSQHELLSCCFCDHVSPNINKLWLLLCYLRVRFQLASPPGFHFNTSRRGTLYIYRNVFFHPSAFFSFPAAGLSSCSRLRGTQGASPPGPCTQVGPRPRSVARALGVERGTPARGGIPSTLSHPGPCKPTRT